MNDSLSRTDSLYFVDKEIIFGFVEGEMRGNQYEASIDRVNHGRDVRGDLLELKSQNTGNYHWNQAIFHQLQFLTNRKWTGGTSFSLKKFSRYTAIHKPPYISVTIMSSNKSKTIAICLGTGMRYSVAFIILVYASTGLYNNFDQVAILLF